MSNQDIGNSPWEKNVNSVNIPKANAIPIVPVLVSLKQESNNSNRKPLTIIPYNARSLNSIEKLKPLLLKPPMILCIQELWDHEETAHIFTNSYTRTRQYERGGGVLTAWNSDFKAIEQHEIGKDSLLTKLIFKNHIQIFLLNVYRTNADPIRTL